MAFAYEQRLQTVSVPASGDLSATGQFRFMDIDSNGRLFQQTVSGAKCAGVLQDKPTVLGQPGELALVGCITQVVTGAAVNNGSEVMSDTFGRAITATTGGKYVMGIALRPSFAAGAIISILTVTYYKA